MRTFLTDLIETDPLQNFLIEPVPSHIVSCQPYTIQKAKQTQTA
jgi:hypothetical protein